MVAETCGWSTSLAEIVLDYAGMLPLAALQAKQLRSVGKHREAFEILNTAHSMFTRGGARSKTWRSNVIRCALVDFFLYGYNSVQVDWNMAESLLKDNSAPYARFWKAMLDANRADWIWSSGEFNDDWPSPPSQRRIAHEEFKRFALWPLEADADQEVVLSRMFAAGLFGNFHLRKSDSDHKWNHEWSLRCKSSKHVMRHDFPLLFGPELKFKGSMPSVFPLVHLFVAQFWIRANDCGIVFGGDVLDDRVQRHHSEALRSGCTLALAWWRGHGLFMDLSHAKDGMKQGDPLCAQVWANALPFGSAARDERDELAISVGMRHGLGTAFRRAADRKRNAVATAKEYYIKAYESGAVSGLLGYNTLKAFLKAMRMPD